MIEGRQGVIEVGWVDTFLWEIIMGKRVSFVTKGGKLVDFRSGSKNRKGKPKRPPNPYARFAGRRIKALVAQGWDAKTAMKQAAKEWRQGRR